MVAYRDTDEPTHHNYHLGKVLSIIDNNIELHTFATTGKNVNTAKWKPVYQNKEGQYTITKRSNQPCKDVVPADAIDDYVWALDLQLGKQGNLSTASRKRLETKKVSHHRLGHTFP